MSDVDRKIGAAHCGAMTARVIDRGTLEWSSEEREG